MASAEVTIASLKALANNGKGKILTLIFDNDTVWFTDCDTTLVESMLVEIGGTEFIKQKQTIRSKRGGQNGGISKLDIPVTEYKPVSTIQAIIVLDNEDDLKFIDKSSLYVQ